MKKRIKAILGIVTLSLATICLVSASFAWFIYNQKVKMTSSSNLEIGVGANLEMSYYDESNDTWSDYQFGALVPSYNLIDVTSDGKKFSYPYNLDTNDEPVFAMLEIPSADRVGYFLEYYVKIRTSNMLNVYLSKNSFVKPHGATNASSVDETNQSAYGPQDTNAFSSNNIAGAARVSIGEVTRDDDGAITNEETKQIWIPNPRYELSYIQQTNGTEEARFSLNGSRESSYGYLANVFTDPNDDSVGYIAQHTYTKQDYLSKYVTVGTKKTDSMNTSWNYDILANPDTGYANEAKCVLDFDQEGIVQEKEIVIRIWIEGTDREANAALNKGVIDYNIELCGLAKREEQQEDIDKLETIYANGYNGKLYIKEDNEGVISYTELTSADNIQYSYNGLDWYDYSTGLVSYYNGSSGSTLVYIRNKESKNYERESLRLLTLRDIFTNNEVDLITPVFQSDTEIDFLHSIVVTGEDGILKSVVSSVATPITSSDNIEYSYDGLTWTLYEDGLSSYYKTNDDTLTTEVVYIRQKDILSYKYTTVCKLSLIDDETYDYSNTIIYRNGGN